MSKIQLFQCENETKILPTEMWTPPFGLAYIATYAKQKSHDVKVYSAVNGTTTQEMIKMAGKADFVGLTTTATTYHTALKIARAAKYRNPNIKIVLGGPEASARAEEAMKNRGSDSRDYCVDAVCYGDGLVSFVDGILENKPMETIPNLVFVKDGKIFKTQLLREDISQWPIIDYSLFDMDKITSSYGEKFRSITPFKRGLGIISGFGCAAKHQCGFCARTDRKLRFRSAEQFWNEVSSVIKDYKVEYFFDFADSILDNPNHLEQIIIAKPEDINPKFRVFARADQLTDLRNLDLLQKLGVYEVFVGFESGSKRMLEAMHKDITPEQNLIAAKSLGERDIFIVGCFVLGAPGENVQTLEESVRHASDIQKASNNHLLVCGASPVNVLPGSPWFALIQNEKGIVGNDDLDRNLLREVWYSKYCPDITSHLIEEYAERIRVESGAKMQYEKGTDR